MRLKINEGRFPKGINSQEEYDQLVDQISKELKSGFNEIKEERLYYRYKEPDWDGYEYLRHPRLSKTITINGHKYEYGYTQGQEWSGRSNQRDKYFFRDITAKEDLTNTLDDLGGISYPSFVSFLLDRSYGEGSRADSIKYKKVVWVTGGYGVSDKLMTLSGARNYYQKYVTDESSAGDSERYCTVYALQEHEDYSRKGMLSTYFTDNLSRAEFAVKKFTKKFFKQVDHDIEWKEKIYNEYKVNRYESILRAFKKENNNEADATKQAQEYLVKVMQDKVRYWYVPYDGKICIYDMSNGDIVSETQLNAKNIRFSSTDEPELVVSGEASVE